jgi:oxaloacetate decarboxylase alpha subunit
MGYPIIVTPVSQFIATQATYNVIDGERWKTVSDETVRYFLGHYGDSPAPVDPDVADRVLSRPGVDKLSDLQPITLDGARRRFGRRISEEELLLRLTMSAEHVDAMLAARGRPLELVSSAGDGRERAPLVELLRALEQRPGISYLNLARGDETVVWRRGD